MDNSNSKFDINLSTPDPTPHESHEACISMATMDSSNTPDSGDCSVSNDDISKAVKALKFKEIIKDVMSTDYVSYFIGNDDCISIDSESEFPEIGDCISSLVHNIFNASNTIDDFLSSVLNNATSNTADTCECPIKGLSVHTEPCTKDYSEYLAESVSSEKIMIDIFRFITELIKICYTHEELNGANLMQMKTKLEDLQDKGLYTNKIASEIQKIAKENDLNEINMEDFYRILRTLSNFSCLERYVNCVIADAHNVKNLKRMKSAMETGQLSDKMLSGCRIIDNGICEITINFSKLKLIEIPDIVDFMKTVVGLGLMSKVLLYKLTNIGKEAIELSTAIHSQIMIVDDTIKELKRLLSKSKLCDGEKQLMKIDKQLQGNICRSEHNIPLCVKCGWRNSWIKAFKKRGVYIKEADSANEKQIWIISTNES